VNDVEGPGEREADEDVGHRRRNEPGDVQVLSINHGTIKLALTDEKLTPSRVLIDWPHSKRNQSGTVVAVRSVAVRGGSPLTCRNRLAQLGASNCNHITRKTLEKWAGADSNRYQTITSRCSVLRLAGLESVGTIFLAGRSKNGPGRIRTADLLRVKEPS
jgi:hypothetical protein